MAPCPRGIRPSIEGELAHTDERQLRHQNEGREWPQPDPEHHGGDDLADEVPLDGGDARVSNAQALGRTISGPSPSRVRLVLECGVASHRGGPSPVRRLRDRRLLSESRATL